MKTLCYYSGKIIDGDNSIIYHRENTELYSLRLDGSYDKLKYLVCQ